MTHGARIMRRKMTFAVFAVGLAVFASQLHSMQASAGKHPQDERGGFSGLDWKGSAFPEFSWARTFAGFEWGRAEWEWGRATWEWTFTDYGWGRADWEWTFTDYGWGRNFGDYTWGRTLARL